MMGQSSRVGPPGPLGVPPPLSGLRAFTDSIPPAEDTFPSPPSGQRTLCRPPLSHPSQWRALDGRHAEGGDGAVLLPADP